MPERQSRNSPDGLAEQPRLVLRRLKIDSGIQLTAGIAGLALIALKPDYEHLSQSVAAMDLGAAPQILGARPDLVGAIEVADFGTFGPLSAIVACAAALAGLKVMRLTVEPQHLSEADRRFFDIGFVRLRSSHSPWPDDGSTAYIRSALITDLDLLGEATGGVVSMSTLGSMGRFANQLFQYAFLKLYGLRVNATPQFFPWIGNHLYGAEAPLPQAGLPMQAFPEFNGIERYLWNTDEPQVNIDFAGFFQELPKTWGHHKNLIRLLLRPIPLYSDPIDDWLQAQRRPGSTLIGIHIRRGDYGNFDHQKYPWFQFIPVNWYFDLLDQIWASAEKPQLLFASDEPNLILRFRQYDPLHVPAAELLGPQIGYFGDFHALCRCDMLTVINSSYSRMAALLAADGQIAFIPDMVEKRFVPYNPWDDEYFWPRFETTGSET